MTIAKGANPAAADAANGSGKIAPVSVSPRSSVSNKWPVPGRNKPAVNTHVDTPGERDLMLTALRVATTRTRLQTNVFDCVGVALRQKQVDCAGAMAWLKEEGLLDHLPFGPGVER